MQTHSCYGYSLTVCRSFAWKATIYGWWFILILITARSPVRIGGKIIFKCYLWTKMILKFVMCMVACGSKARGGVGSYQMTSNLGCEANWRETTNSDDLINSCLMNRKTQPLNWHMAPIPYVVHLTN
jgi:hypothetical protein